MRFDMRNIFCRTIVAIGLLATAGFSVRAEEKALTDEALPTWLAQRIRDWQPAAAERRFDEVGWVEGILAAERLAKEHQRPVFLFTHDGHMAIGRC
jgi:hypothetical protein